MDQVIWPLNFSTAKTGLWTCILTATQNTSMGLCITALCPFSHLLKTQLKACCLPYLIIWLLLALTMLLNYICSNIAILQVDALSVKKISINFRINEIESQAGRLQASKQNTWLDHDLSYPVHDRKVNWSVFSVLAESLVLLSFCCTRATRL